MTYLRDDALFWIHVIYIYNVIFEKNFIFCPVGLDVQSTYTPYYIGAKKISNNTNSLESTQTSQVLINSYKHLERKNTPVINEM